MEINFKEALILAVCNVDEGRTAQEISDILNRSSSNIQSKLAEMRQHGYVVAQPNKSLKLQYQIKPIGYNQSMEVLEKYFKITSLGLQMLNRGFKGQRIGTPEQ